MTPRVAALGALTGSAAFLAGLWLLVALLSGHWTYGLAAVLLTAGAALTAICLRTDDRADVPVPRDR